MGRTYYPTADDKERHEELHRLRAVAPDNWEDVARRSADGSWSVTRRTGEGRSTSVCGVRAVDAHEAIKKAKLELPYVDVRE